MKVIDHGPYAWYLLEDGDDLYLDALCSHSFFDYTVLILLNAAEVAAYRKKGSAFLSKLASDIHYSAPAVQGSRSPFKTRNLNLGASEISRRSDAAIKAWQASQPQAGK